MYFWYLEIIRWVVRATRWREWPWIRGTSRRPNSFCRQLYWAKLLLWRNKMQAKFWPRSFPSSKTVNNNLECKLAADNKFTRRKNCSSAFSHGHCVWLQQTHVRGDWNCQHLAAVAVCVRQLRQQLSAGVKGAIFSLHFFYWFLYLANWLTLRLVMLALRPVAWKSCWRFCPPWIFRRKLWFLEFSSAMSKRFLAITLANLERPLDGAIIWSALNQENPSESSLDCSHQHTKMVKDII